MQDNTSGKPPQGLSLRLHRRKPMWNVINVVQDKAPCISLRQRTRSRALGFLTELGEVGKGFSLQLYTRTPCRR